MQPDVKSVRIDVKVANQIYEGLDNPVEKMINVNYTEKLYIYWVYCLGTNMYSKFVRYIFINLYKGNFGTVYALALWTNWWMKNIWKCW